jgi:hypothetical protein
MSVKLLPVPSRLATLSAIQSLRSSLGQMQGMQGFAGPSHGSCISSLLTDFVGGFGPLVLLVLLLYCC